MMKIIFQIVFFSLLAVNSLGCIKNTANLPNSSVQAVTTSPSFPIIKGLSANPVVRLAITIPDDNPEQQFKAIKGTINAAAINSIQQIDLHLTGAQPFVAGTPLVTIQPAANFEAKFDRKFTPGVYFIWFSIVLKADAGIDGKIELNCTELINAAGKSIAVTKDETDHAKRIGVHTYRIPGLITTDQGTMIAVYDNRYTGTGDLPGNIDVGMSRSIDGGKTWEPMKVIMDMGTPHANNGVGDPAILFDPIAKRLWVAALWSKGNRSIAGSLPGLSPDTTGQFVVVSSDDDGRTWTTPKSITPQIKDPKWHIFFNGPGSGITMQDGKLVFAAQYWDDAKMPYSTIIYSEDRGATWKGNILGPKSNTTESQVVETTPGKLMLNMRDNRGRFRSVATTTNMGATWTEHGTSYSVLPDPVCMGSFIKANVNVSGAAKDILFFSNPNTSSGRYNMTIKASTDLGETWPKNNQLLIDERQCYGYSSLTRIDANTVGLLYEGTRDLYFVRVPVAELIK